MKHLVVTTTADTSADRFIPYADVVMLDQGIREEELFTNKYDTVYFRSHFYNPVTTPQNFEKVIDTIGGWASGQGSYLVDGVGNAQQILAIEDKWEQYKLFATYIPDTMLASSLMSAAGKFIFKKRLSSRASGVAWSCEEIEEADLDNWVVQPRLNIREELRVYVVKGTVIPMAAVRQSKTESSKVKVKGHRVLSPLEVEVAESVAKLAPKLDFIRLDLAVTDSGLSLLEVNRSPDFLTFEDKSKINLAEQFYGQL